MAPPPEYDKEPKAPDKSATNVSSEEPKTLHNSVINDQPTNSDYKPTSGSSNVEIENNKNVEHLTDEQLRALLDETFNYKCPKDREGKSDLFNELLEEVEQDEQECEAARVSGGRAFGRGWWAHSNSMHDLVAATLAAKSAPRRVRAPVSTRAIHGGSLPSGVDTSFLSGEEPRSGGYLATVRCVNPPPLAERRVSTTDEPSPSSRRSGKAAFPLTYTARATLEIGAPASGAVTSTTASNQVRTPTAAGTPASDVPRQRRGRNSALISGQGCKAPLNTANDELPNRSGSKNQPTSGQGRNPPLETTNDKPRNRKGSKQPICRQGRNVSLKTSNGEPPNIRGSIKKPICGKERNPPLKTTNDKPQNRRKSIKQPIRGQGGNPQLLTNQPNIEQRRNMPTIDDKAQTRGSLNQPISGQGRNPPFKDTSNVPQTQRGMKNQPIIDDQIRNPSYNKKQTTTNDHRHNLQEHERSFNQQIDNGGRPNLQSERKDRRSGFGWPDFMNSVDKWYQGITNRFDSSVDRKSHENSVLNAKQISVLPKAIIGNSIAEHPALNIHCQKQDISYEPEQDTCLGLKIDKSKNICDNVKGSNYIENIGYNKNCDLHSIKTYGDTNLIKYRERVGKIIPPSQTLINPKNVRNMSIASCTNYNAHFVKYYGNTDLSAVDRIISENVSEVKQESSHKNIGQSEIDNTSKDNNGLLIYATKDVNDNVTQNEVHAIASKSVTNPIIQEIGQLSSIKSPDSDVNDTMMEIEMCPILNCSKLNCNKVEDNILIELDDFSAKYNDRCNKSKTLEYFSNQEKLLKVLEFCNDKDDCLEVKVDNNVSEKVHNFKDNSDHIENCQNSKSMQEDSKSKDSEDLDMTNQKNNSDAQEENKIICNTEHNTTPETVLNLSTKRSIDQYILAELPNNAYVFLTLPKRLLTPIHKVDTTVQLREIDNSKNATSNPSENLNDKIKPKKKKTKKSDTATNKQQANVNRNALKVLLLDSLAKSVSANKSVEAETSKVNEVDSAIPFSCITTPEVVASSTTTTTSSSHVVVDPKLPAPALAACPLVAALRAEQRQPRSVISTSFNGLPLIRPSNGSTVTTAAEEFKKSLDENGNSVQVGSPLPGSAHKKARRKKSSRNETVIDSHEIDGYQGNKDLDELLRFIESHQARPKRKPHDDDKSKKRSVERRKDKPARAASLDGRPRAPPPRRPPPPAERRSWGDELYYPAPELSDPELTDFQTVTKKRRPRRRADEPRRTRAASPRSPRDNDSNDDLESVTSLPPPRAAVPPASYADITRHNIPDLIESCTHTHAQQQDYPALQARVRRAARKEAECPAPDVVATRPAVVLLAAPAARDLDGVTFGFDVNEQLLGAGRRRCDLVRDTRDVRDARDVRDVRDVQDARDAQPAPPPPPAVVTVTDAALLQLIDYVGHAWEDVIRCGNGKVRYFNE